jgi:predicted unusual protein kinase regulating ubiquinone biosynthesis (AarF/ABC1/UbiB family)
MDVTARQAAVPANRANRLMHLGGLAVGIAGGMLAEGARRASRGELPPLRELLLTPDNAARLADRLSRLRGAAMKVGQLLSMEAGELLPPEFATVLARLREEAHFMPLGQLAEVLDAQWGEGWETGFERFSFTPLAAASIGQVHEARTRDGQHLAIKVQYPGVARSIDSDVDNAAALLRVLPLLPAAASLDELLDEAKRQLHEEADYLREAAHIRQFRDLLGGEPHLLLPDVVDALTTPQVLAMTYVPGDPVERLAREPQAVRDRVAAWLIELLLREFLEFGLVQTDPNFANYRYDADSGRLGLVDFGATRAYTTRRMADVRSLLEASLSGDLARVADAAAEAGYLRPEDAAQRRQAVAELFLLIGEPGRACGAYDFGQGGLAARLRDSPYAAGLERGDWRPPPSDLIFLHRKLAGLFLLCTRLGARVDVAALLRPLVERRADLEPRPRAGQVHVG